ncbi:tandem-95 repeat protein, partial [bacterium]|nr:tandem-95 repeat protein [bacterium]
MAICISLFIVGQGRIAAANLTWDTTIAANSSIGEGAGTWSTGAVNWNNGTTSSGITFANGDNVTIGGGSSGTAGLITLGGTVSPGSITFNTPFAGAYDIGVGSTPAVSMNGGTITANSTQTPKFNARIDGSFTLAGTKTISLTSNGNQTAANTVTINSGATLTLGNNSSAGSVGAAAIINNGTLIWRRASAQTISNPVSGSGSVSYQLRSASFTFNSTGTQSYSGSTTIQPTGADAGSSTLVLDLSNRLPVTTDLTINYNTGSTIKLDLNGKDQTLASISAGGSVLDSIITNNGATRSILTLAGTNKIKTYEGLLSGNMDLILNGSGSTLTLDGANTYTGTTTLSDGTLKIGAAGSAANSPAIHVASAGTLDVSTVANFIVGATQTLSGTGLINGSLTITGTVSPGASGIGTLNFNGALTLAGTTTSDVQKTGASITADLLAGASTLTYGGTLQINATGDALADGDLIDLFDAKSFAGAFTTLAPATPGPGLVWDTSALATSGILRVRSAIRSTTLFVAPTGSAANPGSEASPMTLQRAVELAQPGDTILLRGGVYRETITPLASGTSGAPITFQAYGNEDVTISGADLLPGPWTAGANSIYQTTMPWTLNTPTQGYDQVFIDGEMMMEARFPNTPTLNHTLPVKLVAESASHTVTAATVSTDISTGTFFNAQLTQPPGYWVGASITATFGKIWVAETSTVTASGLGWVTFTFPTPSDKDKSNYLPTAGNPFFLFGKPGELDSGGEWFRDASSQTLTIRTPLSTSPAGLTVEAKRRKLAFNLDSRSWIQVKGIKLFAATITTNASSSQCTFDDLQVRYPAHFTKLARWATGVTDADAGIILRGSGHVLKNSIISDCAGSAVAVIGSGFEVTNNYIHDVNYSGGNGAGVNSGDGYSSTTGSHRHSTSNTKITYNTITRSGQRCIDFTGMTGSVIMYNDVSQGGIQVTDVAPLYVVGTNSQSTDGTFQGPSNGPKTRVAYNFVHDSDGALSGLSGIPQNNVKGIYLDNGSRNFVVDHNVIIGVHSGIVLNIDSSKPSSDNIILNNTVFGNDRSMGWNTNPMTGTIIQNNIFRKGTSTGPNASLITNIASGTAPLLTDEVNGDYTLQVTSPAINTGTAMPPYTDGSVDLPDRGAFEYGLPAWRAGSDRVGSQAWNRVASGGLWGHVANWENGLVPFGAESSADFSQLDITTDNTVLLNAPRTVNQLAFGDLTPASAGSWILSNQGAPANILTLDGLSPVIRVDALGTGKSATISATIGGANGWTKTGAGTLVLSGANTYTGSTQITAGTLICTSPSALGTGALSIGPGGGAKLQLTYTGTRQIASLLLGGTDPQPNGSYGSSASPARFKNDTYFSGVGTVTVGPLNNAPVAGSQNLTTPEDTTLPLTLAGSDADNHPLTFTVVTPPSHGTLTGTTPNLIYTPAGNYYGPDAFTFKANDGEADSAPATVVITVTPVNDAPIAQAQAVTTAEDTIKTITLAGSDLDGDALNYTVLTSPVRGTLGGTPPNLTYTPQGNYNGADSFTFRVNDGIADSAPATVEITVTPVNDAPVAANQSVETLAGVAKDVLLTATDIDLDVLTFAIVTPPANGILSGTPPNLTYTPAPSFQGTDSFTFKANDGVADSAPATVTVTVRSITFIYTNSTSNSAPGTPWSDGTLWNSIPVGGANTTLIFGNGTSLAASQTIFANNNIVGNFALNRLNVTYAGPASGTAPAVTLAGNALELVNDGIIPPTLLFQTTGSVKPSITLNHNLVFTHDATLTTATDALVGGVFSGAGGFTKTGGGILRYQGNSPAYAGNIGVNAGILQVGNNGGAGNLGNGTITLSGSGGFSVRRQGNLTLSN